MGESRLIGTQIVSILKEAEAGRKVEDACREHGTSNATFYRWKSKYGDMEASVLGRVIEIEAENSMLKRMYAGPTFWFCDQVARELGINLDVLDR